MTQAHKNITRLRRFLLIACTAALVGAATASAQTYPLNQASPAGANNNPGVSNGNRGWRFVANSTVTLTQLGMAVPAAGSGLPYSLKVWRVSDQQVVATASLTGNGTETWQWATLGTPVQLVAGTQYIVTLGSAGNFPYFFSSSTTYQPSGTIQYIDMRYSNSSDGGDVFPVQTLSGINYGFVDIGYGAVTVGTPTLSEWGYIGLTGLLLLVGIRKFATAA